jgi:predicted lipoprotein with Yx(FWY)xxD motif
MHLLKRSALAMLFIASVITSCSKDDNDGGTPPPPPVPQKTVKIANNTTFGAILTDSTGKSLYFFSNDAQGAPTCTGGCTAIWPTFYVAIDELTVDSSLNKADFTTVTRPDGSKQTAYKGWPLYYYASDAAAGDTKGDNILNIWFVAKPDYSVMVANFQLHGNDTKDYVLDNTGTIALGTGASKYLVDDRGQTLYKFANDKAGVNNWTNADAAHNAIWPIYEIGEVKNVPTGFAKADFTIITVLGKKQITYKGWPLYYFGADAKVMGANKGVSVPAPNVWPVVYTTTAAAPLP